MQEMDSNQEKTTPLENREVHPGIVEVADRKKEISLKKTDYEWLGHATETVQVILLKAGDTEFYFGKWIDNKDLKEASQQIDRQGKSWRRTADSSLYSKLPTFVEKNFYHPEVAAVDQPKTSEGTQIYSVKTARKVRPYFIAIRTEEGESVIICIAECMKGDAQKKVLRKISYHE
jgi:hypothetical protein